MDRSRRLVLSTWFSGVAAFFLGAKAISGQGQAGTLTAPPPKHREPTSADEGEGPGTPPGATKAVLEQHQKEIKKDVEKLFDLATELKAEVEKTDATAVLSLAMLKKTEEIERLARQIRDHAKG